MIPAYFYGTLSGDAGAPSHKIVDIGPRLDGVPGLEVHKLLASCTTFESALAAGRLFEYGAEPLVPPATLFKWKWFDFDSIHHLSCDLDLDCSCG